ncbi:hypothetical protein [Synechocystis sp. PCC 7509]|uniref:hypothetical protein n=1 Tax=Synechocystis sp. PCC 7509 TaxID=927677 RepID=UPI0002AC7C62|nr:hypothetical protein [Synechocystis sp. PCC 7509]
MTEKLRLISEVGFKESICETILDIHRLDPGGITFRYPLDKQGNLTLLKQKTYDLRNIQERMEVVRNSFEGATTWLQVTTDSVHEYLLLYQQQMSEFETDLPTYDFEGDCY